MKQKKRAPRSMTHLPARSRFGKGRFPRLTHKPTLRKNVLTGQERFTVRQGATFLKACLPANPQCDHTDRACLHVAFSAKAGTTHRTYYN